jgi:ribosome biogenesis GTPase
MLNGFITSLNGGIYTVYKDDIYYSCQARGLFRIKDIKPMVGDIVNFDVDEKGRGYITEILPRTNQLIRPPVSNVEQVVIIVSLAHPRISLGLISRYIIVASLANVKPIIVINKIDREDLDKEYYEHVVKTLTSFGYQIIPTSAKTNENINELKAIFEHKKSIVTGQSGVGKSSLLNAIFGVKKLETNEISKALNRGKHTTRIVEYFKYGNAFIADTPGFSLIDFNISAQELAYLYPGFEKYLNICKFRGCLHEHEKSCGVKEDVKNNIIPQDHYEDYLSLLQEIKNKKEY